MQEEQLAKLEAIIGYTFQAKTLLSEACTHRSYANEHRGEGIACNERLEFLGDSVLGVIVSLWLWQCYPDAEEGMLTRWRSQIVDANACASYAAHLGLEPFVLLGKGEQRNLGRGRQTILADLFEAVVAALFLDGGMAAATSFILDKCSPLMEGRLSGPESNYKALLQDILHRHYVESPEYIVTDEQGPAHSKTFTVDVYHRGELLGSGTGCNKRKAQQEAAKHAISKLKD